MWPPYYLSWPLTLRFLLTAPQASVNSDEDYHHGYNNDAIEEEPPPPLKRTGGSGQESSNGIRGSFNSEARGSLDRFARGSARQSLANNVIMYKWLEAQERQQEHYEVCLQIGTGGALHSSCKAEPADSVKLLEA